MGGCIFNMEHPTPIFIYWAWLDYFLNIFAIVLNRHVPIYSFKRGQTYMQNFKSQKKYLFFFANYPSPWRGGWGGEGGGLVVEVANYILNFYSEVNLVTIFIIF